MSNALLPAGYLVNVEMIIRVPISATAEQIEEWLHFNLTSSGGLASANPLSDFTPETFRYSDFDCTFTDRVGERVEYGHEKTETGGTRYRVRYVERPASEEEPA
jgi:hypothetical protein